ncbi:MAG: dihydroxyacetone kinase subunit DhaK [Phascolarctobacterium sp.]|nr:dihydroxyacetone kinase subunit DhaK [Phascolarctobacterium sp.]
MQKFINAPESLTTEMLQGLALAHSEIVSLELGGKLVVNKKLAEADRVTVVTLGASGHEPAICGFVGEGMVDVAVVGDVFAAPGPQACIEAVKLADKGHGVLLVVLNHAGDTLAANLAMKQAEKLGLNVAKIVVQEDIANASREEVQNRRGMVGCVPLYKIAGAAAQAGKSLEEVAELAQSFADNMATLAVAASGATNPVTGMEIAQVAAGCMEVGVGLHGEKGKAKPLQTAEETAKLMLDALLEDLNVLEEEKLLVIVSGSGATSLMEQLIVFRNCYAYLNEKNIEVVASHVGELMTVQEMAGFEICLARMNEELLVYWNAPCYTPYFKK